MTIIDLDAVRERRNEEREGLLFERVRTKALGEAERAFAVANSILRVDTEMAIDVCRGTRHRLLVWVRNSLQGEADDMRAYAIDFAWALYQSRLTELIDDRFDCGAPRQT